MANVIRRIWFATAALLISLIATASAQTYVGRAYVIDGDTIEVQEERIRINGIDAPESEQTCDDATGEAYNCGSRATLALAEYLGQRTVHCEEVARDIWDRAVARCSVGGEDVAAWLVRNGWALDWRRYSKGAYAADQRAARRAKRGMWAGTFVKPRAWRRQARR